MSRRTTSPILRRRNLRVYQRGLVVGTGSSNVVSITIPAPGHIRWMHIGGACLVVAGVANESASIRVGLGGTPAVISGTLATEDRGFFHAVPGQQNQSATPDNRSDFSYFLGELWIPVEAFVVVTMASATAAGTSISIGWTLAVEFL